MSEQPLSISILLGEPVLNLDWRWFESESCAPDEEGVYVICREVNSFMEYLNAGKLVRTTLYVGSGNIRDRIRAALMDPRVSRCCPNRNELNAAWAPVDPQNQEGVEKYLAETMKPKVGCRHPDVKPILATFPY